MREREDERQNNSRNEHDPYDPQREEGEVDSEGHWASVTEVPRDFSRERLLAVEKPITRGRLLGVNRDLDMRGRQQEDRCRDPLEGTMESEGEPR